MKNRKSSIIAIGSSFIMLLLILDAKTSLAGATEGIDLCIRTVIPSLFPFFFLSGIINGFVAGKSFKLFRPLGALCGIPVNAEYLLLIGFTGGYPVGAQCISNAYKTGTLTKQDAERMLGFCNNAGPAFIFGMMSQAFSSLWAAWILWGISIVCALITAFIFPDKSNKQCKPVGTHTISLSNALHSAMKAMSTVCGWVIIFRVLIYFFNRWVFWLLPEELCVMLTGFLELSNGCIGLNAINNLSLRFIAGSFMLSFGGLCVGLQTSAVCPNLSCRYYFIGKTIQAILSIPLSIIAAAFLFPGNVSIIFIIGCFAAVCMVICIFLKLHWKYNYKSCIIG